MFALLYYLNYTLIVTTFYVPSVLSTSTSLYQPINPDNLHYYLLRLTTRSSRRPPATANDATMCYRHPWPRSSPRSMNAAPKQMVLSTTPPSRRHLSSLFTTTPVSHSVLSFLSTELLVCISITVWKGRYS